MINEINKRNHAQDVLRGFIVALAILEHFSMMLNTWYRDFFSVNNLYSLFEQTPAVKLYELHSAYLGKHLPVDSLYETVGIFFIPWLTHLFIALSGYNLARKSPHESYALLPKYLKFYGVFFLVFLAEQLIVSPNFGFGLSLFPITVWFIVLALTHIAYAYTGIKGVVALFTIIFSMNMMTNVGIISIPTINQLMVSIHPWATHSTEPIVFLGDCLWGLSIGFVLMKVELKRAHLKIVFVVVSILTGILSVFVRDLFKLDANVVALYDGILHKDNLGVLFIYFINTSILLGMCLLGTIKVPRFFSLFEWVGRNSLGLFFIHRILFLKVLAPVRLHLTSYINLPMGNSSWELMFIYFPLTLITFWLLKRVNFFGKLFLP